jgi:acetylornithine deacetylase
MLNGLAIKPAMCIVGEPTSMKVVVGHKGKRAFRVEVRGLECHSSLAPQGVNAVDFAAELVVFIRALADRLAREGPRDPDYAVPHTTIHTGTIGGGTALNIVPRSCVFEGLIAEIENYARGTLEPRMRRIAAEAGISFEPIVAYAGLDTDPGEEVVTFVKSLVGANEHGKVSFGSEGGLFQRQAGIPTVICGPGDIAQAHKPDEWISLEQVALCDRFMERLIERLSA